MGVWGLRLESGFGGWVILEKHIPKSSDLPKFLKTWIFSCLVPVDRISWASSNTGHI